jgi:hypothetical protein
MTFLNAVKMQNFQDLDNPVGHVDVLRRRRQIVRQREAGSVSGSNDPVPRSAPDPVRIEPDRQNRKHFSQQPLPRGKVCLLLPETRCHVTNIFLSLSHL